MTAIVVPIKHLRVMYAAHGEYWHLGTLSQVDTVHTRDLLFSYTEQAKKWGGTHGVEMSALHAPIANTAAQAYRGPAHFQGLPGFIADALPDGWGMLLMDRALRRLGRDPRQISVLERLAIVGSYAIGGLAFEPADEAGEPVEHALTLLDLASDVRQVLHHEDGPSAPAQSQLLRLLMVGGSPQGARPKALLRYEPNSNTFAVDRAIGKGEAKGKSQSKTLEQTPCLGTPWLIKFPAQGEHAEVCALEELYARLARKGGIEMPVTRYFALGKNFAAFGVQRFDRVSVLNKKTLQEQRIPVQSMAAFLHADYRLPSLDYETVLQATWAKTRDVREVAKAFSRCVFNVLTHNRDDHAKNFAFVLGADMRWKLSPAFDLTFSIGPRGEHSTSVSGEGLRPCRKDLLKVASKGSLSAAQANQVIDHWLHVLGTPDQALIADLPIRTKTLLAVREQLTRVWSQI